MVGKMFAINNCPFSFLIANNIEMVKQKSLGI